MPFPSDTARELVRSRLGSWSGAKFAARAAALATQLPEAAAAVNLCEQREHFLIAFAALLLRGQPCLLPPSRTAAVVDEVLAAHPGAYRIDDAWVASAGGAGGTHSTPPEPADDRVVVIGYTSGTTGRPKPNPKTWGSLRSSTALNVAAVRAALPAALRERQPWLIATVPPQHMYGLEMSVLLPLLGGFGIHGGRPLYPADIADTLAGVPEPRVLVSTPVHLRALLESGVALPAVQVIVSATAPLSMELAQALEARIGAALLEFFGSTETCVIAARRTALESSWHAYDGVVLQPLDDGTRVSAPWFPEAVLLQDVLELQAGQRFTVRGRNADLVEVAGKRASLADLTRRLQAIPGVEDAVVFQPGDSDGVAVRRLAALVVAPALSEAQILGALGATVDPVFLPRPLLRLPRLPRNEVGKLPRAALLEALRR
jgi:acyl-coenzyme A synthetase/AMP-(fatty) acid ligase